MKKYNLKSAAILTTIVLSFVASGVVLEESHADTNLNAAPVKAYVSALPAAPECGAGFQVKNKQLHKSGGKSWYTYRCVRQSNIYRLCSKGLSVLMPKNTFKNLAGTPEQVNSILKMSYTCAHPAG